MLKLLTTETLLPSRDIESVLPSPLLAGAFPNLALAFPLFRGKGLLHETPFSPSQRLPSSASIAWIWPGTRKPPRVTALYSRILAVPLTRDVGSP